MTMNVASGLNTAALAPVSAQSLNLGCACRTLNQESLRRQLEAEPSLAGLYEEVSQSRPHLFSATTVFISSYI
ncbi:MAG: hypothetical protein Q8Q76_05265 [Methylotenera sp.]|nr:hypothetical protein [Methylotenera sp.]